MAIWYWDPVGGNNANDGTTFANRKLTLQSLTTVAAGDTVRCIKSPDAVSTGINATWTDGSNTVTLASAPTLTVANCDSNWTASTNVTCSTSTVRKEGTASQSTAIAAAFTTGKASYFATGSLNLSSYQQLTFWIKQTLGTAAVAGDYTISLCSDTAGATQVNNFAIPAIPALSIWTPVTIDLGTNLGSTIQSIAFYVNVDRGAVTFLLDNFCAVPASANANAISLTSLIGKGGIDNQYLGIRSINGTTVILDTAPQYTLDLAGTEPLWSGVSETVALYRRETLKVIPAAALTTVVNNYAGATGSAGNIVTISGGWDTTNMSTQTGQTYLDGQTGNGYGLSLNAAAAFNYGAILNINCIRYNIGLYINPSATMNNTTITADNFNNNMAAGVSSNTGIQTNTNITINNICKNGYSSSIGNGLLTSNINKFATFTIINANSNWLSGINFTGTSSYANTITVTNANSNIFNGFYIQSAISNTITVSSAQYNCIANFYGQIFLDNSGNFGVGTGLTVTINSHDNIINVGNLSQSAGTTSAGIVFAPGADNNKVIMTGVFTGFTNSSFPCILSVNAGTNYLTSAGAPFVSSSQYWSVTLGSSKMYLNTLDTTTPTLPTASGQNGISIFKSGAGIQGQTVTNGTSWGIA